MSLQRKLKKLKQRLKSLKSVLVAYSGGVDSTLLLKLAKDELGDKVLAVTAHSEIHPADELKNARSLAQALKSKHRIIRTHELNNPQFRNNPKNRCWYCKRDLFLRLKKLANQKKLNFIIDGSNVDDLSDYRPGSEAKKELGVISPFQEAGLTKKDIRELSRKFRLMTWNKPAMACLASRIPYYSSISKERLRRIDKAEEILRKSFDLRGNVRVRDFQDLARIEVDKDEIEQLVMSKRIRVLFGNLGYKNVVIDSRGYRCGSMNKEMDTN